MILRFLILICLGASLSACSYHFTAGSTAKNVPLEPTSAVDSSVLRFIQPFSDSLAAQMNVILGKAPVNFIVSVPSSNLMNWSADALFVEETKTVKMSEPAMVILNAGGLRASINQGTVTVGDIYKLMPFDNTVAWVRLPIDRIAEIESFLKTSKGMPLSNATYEKGKLTLNGLNENHTHFWVITSDYLAKGGDKMNFFMNPTEFVSTNRNLRDVFMQAVKSQGTLVENTEIRFIP
jgi:2',3'-cyclic-nucleotide 2'-phosphodiesterase (5'-nucleotidase family)